ncbi:MAG: ABC transporter [Gallionellales bacterium RIFCSPLOWO2_12_FULL_59_22]|nr:MAG: ABC transporter [Gallionellales bacterium RIFCSPLOWO2_02_FULL_59_110]OGT13489.1 MAG: ABC transporter [Gallionellales bacterium RIFCSPLOWO2_12_FULL_59_22]
MLVDTNRIPVVITLSVWEALFLRETVSRLSAGRAAWLWLLMEPVFHIVFLMFIFAIIRMEVVGGVDTAVWLMVGLLAFFMFKRTALQAQNAIDANQALFAYRQVKPVDTVLVRAALEGFLMVLVAVILFFGAGLFGPGIAPADPLAVLEAFFGLWLVGLGFGLMASVAIKLVPELGKFLGLVMTPLYFFSGVIFPIANVPQPYRDWLLFNPVVHGLEAARLGFVPHYHAVSGLSMAYVYSFALLGIFLGLALHVRFAARLTAK